MPTTLSLLSPCPCGSGATFGRCCGPLHTGRVAAPTAESLMRSRFTAYVTGDQRYLERTWHPRTLPRDLELDPKIRWTGLTITDTIRGGEDDPEGIVAFRATHLIRTEAGAMVERSLFQRVGGAWLYVGEVRGRPGSKTPD